MQSNLLAPSPTLSYLFVLIIITLLSAKIPPCFCQRDYRYIACGHKPFSCANIHNMVYPFWGLNRPDYCGHKAFHLTNCHGDIALIKIGSISYQVLSLNESTRSLTVARADMSNNACPSFLFNTTFDSTQFTPSPTTQILSLHYGCTAQFKTHQNWFNCTVNETQSLNYFTTDVDRVSGDLSTCRSIVIVMVNGTWGKVLSNQSASVRDLEAALDNGFGVEWSNDSLCDKCRDSGGWCGSETSSDFFRCYCSDGEAYEYICHTKATRYYGFAISGSAVAIIIFIVIIYYCRRRFTTNEEIDDGVEAFLSNHGSLVPRRYSYNDIKKMTNSFADKLGQGGYGSVFKGKLLDGRPVAVKVLTDTNGDGGDFVNEVDSISKTSHVNVVTLLGFCLERNKRALIYEFMPNKSLDKFIHNNGNELFSLDGETLFRIALGTARGLEYLHSGCNTRIVHFDIKPENILLDEDFCPKISDFGLAKLCKRKKSIVSVIGTRGTPGYISPEVFCRNFGEVTHKSDVYSYGMMVINMLGLGEKTAFESGTGSSSEMYFPDFIYKHLELGKDIRRLRGAMSEEMARKMVLVGLWCIQTNPLHRPSMSKVVEMLEGSIESIQFPPKASLFSTPRENQDSCSSISSDEEIELVKSSIKEYRSRKIKSELKVGKQKKTNVSL